MATRAVFLVAAALVVAAAKGAVASTPALVVDAASGKVLMAERATDPWFPASITKLMTTYVALDLVRQGRFSMNSLLTMSPEAAAEPPSKMGFKPGTQLTLENALKIILVKSANDVSWMIGENLGGSIEGFAGLMNAASRKLGMHDSRWVNPNGLPDDRQQTTARDMAILARALLTEFPEQEDLFHIGALKLGRQVIRNHNGLLGRYPGADGMKTGFICAGGFNIVASATQNGRRLITVVMGYPSARERDLRTADLFDLGFSTLGWGAGTVSELPPSGALSPPNMRAFVCGGNKRQPQEDDQTSLVASGAPSQNGDNPIATLFSPLTYATASVGSVPAFRGRTSLGPRVAFEPIPIWLGPSPGAVPDESDKTKATGVAIAAKPVRTRLVGKPEVRGTLTASSLSAPVPPSGPDEGERIETVKTSARPGGREALSANLGAKPAAETRPKLGAVGSGGSRPGGAKHGAIAIKPTLPVAALETVELKGVKAGSGTTKPGVTKPGTATRVAAKPAATKAASARPASPKPASATAAGGASGAAKGRAKPEKRAA
ncbi:MAG: peptidase D-alanyl-D-alanine carboxypeptidase 1, partial [Enterovirga sp.]|nr:peptidase D-alanyl-D-alanine carboxypeptidase 1 [Enterovirga sp.]